MSVFFTAEEMAAIAYYSPEKGRASVAQAISQTIPHLEDDGAAALLRGVAAKLLACTEQEFDSCGFAAAAEDFF